jgi:nucleotide-binding universal stress UspA family protein
MISKILVPTDGSETARKAVRYAGDLAKQTGAVLTLLSVIDKEALVAKSIPAIASPTHIIEPVEDYLRMAAETYLKDAEKLCRRKGVKIKKVSRSGHPVEEIIKEAKRLKADLIVMGSRGKSAIKTAVLGSVTFGVIHRDTKFPVLVIRN